MSDWYIISNAKKKADQKVLTSLNILQWLVEMSYFMDATENVIDKNRHFFLTTNKLLLVAHNSRENGKHFLHW